MSVTIMSMSMYAEMGNLEYQHNGFKKNGEPFEKKIKISANVAKTVLVNLADHVNDEGEGAYPGLTRLEVKTDLSRITLTRSLRALEMYGLISLAGKKSSGANDYSINIEKLLSIQHKISRFYNPELVNPVYQGSKPSLPAVVNPVYQGSKPSLPEPSVTINKPSLTDSPPVGDEPATGNQLADYFGEADCFWENAQAKKDLEQPSKKKKGTRKTSVRIQNLERLELAFALVRGCAVPEWDTDKKARANQVNWRQPLAALLNECAGDVECAEAIVNQDVKDYLRGDQDPRYPMVVPRSFESRWIARAIAQKNKPVVVQPEMPEELPPVIDLERLQELRA